MKDYREYNLKKGYKNIYSLYEINNHLMTCWLDIYWRKKAVNLSLSFLKGRDFFNKRSKLIYCDFCVGTGEFLYEMYKRLEFTKQDFIFLGLDFSFDMVSEARRRRKFDNVIFILADVSFVPFKSDSLDLVSISLGIRNLRNTNNGIVDEGIFYRRFREINRVIRKGGYFLGMETSRPPNKFIRFVVDFFTLNVFTNIAKLLSFDFETYSYLARSMVDFFDANQFCKFLKDVDFEEVNYFLFTFGVVALHIAKK